MILLLPNGNATINGAPANEGYGTTRTAAGYDAFFAGVSAVLEPATASILAIGTAAGLSNRPRRRWS